MAKAKVMPTDIEGLREELAKLKDKEARLEADLVVREHPDLEKAIIRLILVMTEVRKAEKDIAVTDKPPETARKQIEALQNQLRFYENKIVAIKAQIESLSGDAGTKFATLRSKRAEAVLKLQAEWTTAKPEFDAKSVKMLDLIPSLNDLLNEKIVE